MNKIKCIALAMVFTLAMPSVHAQVKNPDTMVRKVFATLVAKDEKAFVALYPNAQQFGRFVGGLMKQTFSSPEMRKMFEADSSARNMNIDSLVAAQTAAVSSPEAFGKMAQKFGQMFQETIARGEKKGVNWSNATLTSYTIDTSATENEGLPPGMEGLKTMKGVIDFTSGGKPFQVSFDKVLFLPAEGGWFGAEFPQVARKGESLAPDKEGEDAGNAASPKAAAPGKTKTKVTPSKTKVKTKTKS